MAKTEPITDAIAFVDLLEKSDLLASDLVSAIRKAAPGYADASALARQLVKEAKLTRWQAQQLLLGSHRLTVAKYRLFDQIGKGPMGRVYLAEHGKLGKKVSLKVLSARFSAKPEVLKQFLDEATRAGALNHRNIIHIFDVGSENDRYYLVVEYVEGKDLERLVEAGGPLPPPQAIDLVRQTAEGLAHAHERSLTHGDLKPSNLLVDGAGVVKILDLGLSGLADTSASGDVGEESTEAPSLAALAFRAPELLASDRRSDVRSDLYSLGAVLYYLLTGKAPSRNETDAAGKLVKMPGVAVELANLCDHLLAANPQERPESAAHVVAALDLAGRVLAAPERTADRPTAERPSSAGRTKRPLVAKPLEEPAAPVVSVGESNPDKHKEDNSLAGFAIKTGRKRKVTSQPAVASAATADARETAASRSTGARRPLILAAAVGAGVLAIAALVTIVALVLNRGDSQDVASLPPPATTVKSSKSPPKNGEQDAAGESNPESSLESNPPIVTESKIVAPLTPGSKGSAPAATTSPRAADAPAESNAATPDPPAATSTPPASTPAPTPATPTPPPPGEPKPEPVKPDAAPTPQPAPPAGNPFAEFAAAVSLPPLEAMGKPNPDAQSPLPLGFVKVGPSALCIIKLKGGETAFKGKNKFLLESANRGTAERDWEFKLQSDDDAPLVIATMSLKEDQLVFQWTEEAAKQQAAPHLCNCLLSLTAGSGTHQVALRKPVIVPPLAAEVEKGAINERFNLEYPPGGKQIVVEIGPLAGGPPKHRVDPKTELDAFRDSTYLFAGNADDALFLGFKIDVSMPAKTLQIVAQPQYMLKGMPKPDRYLKATAGRLSDAVGKGLLEANIKLQVAKQFQNQDQKKKGETIANAEMELAKKGMAQVEQLKDIAKSLQESGKIHFRAYYLADDSKVDLINTGAPPPPPTPMPPPAAK